MSNKIKQTVGENIKKFRKKNGLSQIELAYSVGKQSATYIAYIEKGERNVTITDLIEIANALETTVSDLIGEGMEIDGNESIGIDGFKKGYNKAINDMKKLLPETLEDK